MKEEQEITVPYENYIITYNKSTNNVVVTKIVDTFEIPKNEKLDEEVIEKENPLTQRREKITNYINNTIEPIMKKDVITFPYGSGPYYDITYNKISKNVAIKYEGNILDQFTIRTTGGKKNKSKKLRKSRKTKKSKKSRKIKGGVPCHRMGCPFCRGRYSSRCPYMR